MQRQNTSIMVKNYIQGVSMYRKALKRQADLQEDKIAAKRFKKQNLNRVGSVINLDARRGEILRRKNELRNRYNLTGEELKLYKVLIKKSKLDKCNYLPRALKLVVEYKDFWLRDPYSWLPKQYNANVQFSEFIKYTFAKYSMPDFMCSAWKYSPTNHLWIEWFLDLAKGASLKDLRKYPKDLTARMRHMFLQSPSRYEISEAIIRAKINAMGGDKALLDAILQSPIHDVLVRNQTGTNKFTNPYIGYDDTAFWDSVIYFFINNPMLDRNQFSPLCDYLQEIKYKWYREYGSTGSIDIEPVYPNFQIKGRNPVKLFEDMTKWHKQLQKIKEKEEKAKAVGSWFKSVIPNFEYIEGKAPYLKKWAITELTTASQIFKEGQELNHCVATYIPSCGKGTYAIFSLSKNGLKRITILVYLDNKSIGQCRGVCNRLPDIREKRIINLWASQYGLRS